MAGPPPPLKPGDPGWDPFMAGAQAQGIAPPPQAAPPPAPPPNAATAYLQGGTAGLVNFLAPPKPAPPPAPPPAPKPGDPGFSFFGPGGAAQPLPPQQPVKLTPEQAKQFEETNKELAQYDIGEPGKPGKPGGGGGKAASGEFLTPGEGAPPGPPAPLAVPGMPGTGGGGGVIPAHSQPLVDPKLQQKYFQQAGQVQGAVGERMAAAEQLGDANAQAWQQQARGIEGERDVLGQSADQFREMADERAAKSDAYLAKMEQYANAIRERKFDPEAGWKKQGTGGQIALAISALAFGWLQGRGKIGHNPALEKVMAINKMDLDAQYKEAELDENKLKNMQTIYGLAYRQTGDKMEAYKVAMGMGLENAKLETARLAALSKDPIVRAEAQQTISDLGERQQTLGLATVQKEIDFNRWIPAMATGTPGTGAQVKDLKAEDVIRLPDGRWVTVAKPDREDVRKKMHLAQEASTAIRKLEELDKVPQSQRDQNWARQWQAAGKVFTGPEIKEGKGGLGVYQIFSAPLDATGGSIDQFLAGKSPNMPLTDTTGAVGAAKQINTSLQRAAYDSAASSATLVVEPTIAQAHGKDGHGKVEFGYVVKGAFDPKTFPGSRPEPPGGGGTGAVGDKKTPYK